MKVAVRPSLVPVEAGPALRQRLADYLELTKPRIATLVLVTVAAGYLMAAGTGARLLPLIHTLIGTTLVAGAASAWNMWLERVSDARMRRTANRPLPAGRLHHLEVVVFGTALAVTGVNYLYHAVNPMAALVAVLTFVTYVAVYTPLKPLTEWNTHVGAIPGALPPVIGWCAATGTIGWDAGVLFAVILFWQLPHFMAIAWMYRKDYGLAGMKMIPVADPTGTKTSRSMTAWCLVLIAASLLPLVLRPVDWVYVVGALALGGYFLRSTLKFRADRTEHQARQVLKASILYLPGIMGLLLMHALVTGLGCSPPSPPTGAVRATDLDFPVPEFKLIERSGKAVSRDDLKGKVWVASFVFVRCSGPCPQISATMAKLQSELKLAETPDLRLVTFTVDPDRDTPAELKDYAKNFAADPDRWLFLTGPEVEIHELLTDGFKTAVVKTGSPTVGEEYDHSSRLAVVDKAGVIRAYFDGMKSKTMTADDFADNLVKLKAKVAELLKE